MIHFSRDEDYAVILVNTLAKQHKKRLVPLSEVAKQYNISLFYLRNLANKLVHKGVIKAVEGKKGGYFLQKDPKRITIGEILETFSRKPMLECCSIGSKTGTCDKVDFCETGHIWRKLHDEFFKKIARLSISDFMALRREKHATS
ncbi:MAG: Rrf2 family transcriptional regulator [Candidatus Levybacteria bacterium]|nr:Rrf2 family transcriptional regulator [Candidatus Levybacteria bacterium]